MRSLINAKTKSNKQITSLNINNQIETNPENNIRTFQQIFFPTFANDIDNKIISTNKIYKGYLNASVVNSFFLTPKMRN